MNNEPIIESVTVSRSYAHDDREYVGHRVDFSVFVPLNDSELSPARCAADQIARLYGNGVPASTADDPTMPEAPGEQKPAEEAPRRRRGAPDASTAEPTTAASAEGGRRRRSPPAEPASEGASGGASGEKDAEDPAPRRRRAPPVEVAEPTKPVSESLGDGLSDLDLSKAASLAASILTPKVVLEIIQAFDSAPNVMCKSVADIPEGDRDEFLRMLKKETRDAEAAKAA